MLLFAPRTAHYYNFKDAKDIAWYYPDPKEKAVEIKGMVAFYCSKHPGELDLSFSSFDSPLESLELMLSTRLLFWASGDLVVEELVEGKWGRVPEDEEEGEKAKEDEK